MRIQIEPVVGLLGQAATHFSCDSAELVRGNVVCKLAFWSDGGRKLAEDIRSLHEDDYIAWCETGPESDDMDFLVHAHAARLGLAEVVPPPPAPPAPDEPPGE